MEDTYLKDNIKKCVDYVMSKNDDDKRRILNGMFQYNDYLINEQLVVKALNDEEKQEWFNNEIFEAKDKEIERLNNIINKAIEYINENWGHWCSNHFKYATETINILKGSDKE